MDLSTTKDLLFLVLAVAVVAVTGFFCWLLYYLIAMIRDARSVTKEVASGIAKVHDILDTIKETLTTSTSHLGLIVGAVKEIVSFYQRRHSGDGKEDEDGRGSKRRKR